MSTQRSRLPAPPFLRWLIFATWLLIAAGLLLLALGAAQTSAFIRSLSFSADPASASAYDRETIGAAVASLVALALGTAIVLLPTRLTFSVSALSSLIPVGTGIVVATGGASIAGDPPALLDVHIAGLAVSLTLVGVMMTVSAVMGLGGSALGMLASPVGPAPRPFMPPPTHQGG
jgi:hypothetical protein